MHAVAASVVCLLLYWRARRHLYGAAPTQPWEHSLHYSLPVYTMDPLSAAANTIAVLGLTGQSCQFLFNFFRSVLEAPKDIQHYTATLRALHSTFSRIQLLCLDEHYSVRLSPEFGPQLTQCMIDLKTTAAKIRKIDDMLTKSRVLRTWAKFKWSSSSDHWLGKFFSRVQMYHTMFSLELMTIQM
jgi:hypothetical protein